MAASRKPVHKREVEIIKRLKSAIKLPVTKNIDVVPKRDIARLFQAKRLPFV